MITETLTLEWPETGVALLTLTRGEEMNTLTQELLRDFDLALDQLAASAPRALIVTGSGRAFCCGAHLDYFEQEHMTRDARFDLRDGYLEKIATLFDRLEQQNFPLIAAINGFALGGGCELALSCDFRIMSRETRLGLPEVRLGALAGAGGVQKLSRYVGRGKAMEWILLGSQVTAEEAERFGLLYATTDPGEELSTAIDLARGLSGLSARAVAQSKRAVLSCETLGPEAARRFGLEALSMLVDSSDWAEGIAAFHEKRAPDFASSRRKN